MSKFILLYLFTFGLYGIIWFYRNWRYIKRERDPDIWPLPRAVFSILTYYWFLLELRHEEEKSLHGALAIAWFLMLGGSSSLGFVWFASFLPLLPAVEAVNDLNDRESIPMPPNGKWRRRNIPAIVIGAFVYLLAYGSGAVTPSDRVLSGDQLREAQRQYLTDIGLVGPNDELLYFYSAGVFSIRGEGGVLTKNGIGAYWTDEVTGDVKQAFVKYQDIDEADIVWSESWLDDSVLWILSQDTTVFAVVLSPEEAGDSTFFSEFERRREQVQEW